MKNDPCCLRLLVNDEKLCNSNFGLLNLYYYFNIRKHITTCRPRGNVLASRSKVRGFKPDRGRWIFKDVKILSTSPPRGTLNWGSRV